MEYTEQEKAKVVANIKQGEPDECWLWQGAKSKCRNYIQPNVYLRGRTKQAARATFEIFHRPLQPGEWVLHKCDVSMCCNPAHLYAGDAKQNAKDTFDRNRFPIKRGVACTTHKLTEDQVRTIKRQGKLFGGARTGWTRGIARELGISHSMISNILSGKNWAHIKP
jgi:hypothetical protein